MLRNWQIKKSDNSTKHKNLSIHLSLIFAPMNDLSDRAVQQTLAAVRTEGEFPSNYVRISLVHLTLFRIITTSL